MTAHKRGGWRTPLPRPIENPGFSAPPGIKRTSNAPADSWWTRPTLSRAEFDQLAEQRSREAGWVGKPREDGR